MILRVVKEYSLNVVEKKINVQSTQALDFKSKMKYQLFLHLVCPSKKIVKHFQVVPNTRPTKMWQVEPHGIPRAPSYHREIHVVFDQAVQTVQSQEL